MIKLLPIEHVFNYIPKEIRNQQDDDDQLLSWSLQYLNTIPIPIKQVKDIIFLEVASHTALLPSDLSRIYRVQYLTEEATLEEIEELNCDCETDNTSLPTDVDDCNVYHQMFLNSDFYKNKWSPLKYEGFNLSDKYVCNVQFDSPCVGTYSLTSNLSAIKTSHKSGIIGVEYFKKAKVNGSFGVPEHPEQLWLAMSHYTEAMHWRNRSSMKEANAYNMYMTNMQQARQYRIEAKSIITQMFFNMDTIRSIISMPSRILKAAMLNKPKNI